jgi:metal-responsive CopG/Arc/MetJ family transcriptional regulator
MKDQETDHPATDGGKRAERLQVMLTDEELLALDNWRFSARMPSRSAAVRELMRRGLAAEGYFRQAAQKGQSSNFGILDQKP